MIKKNLLKATACTLLTSMAFSTYAYAFGVNFSSKSAPESVKSNSTCTYSLSLVYDTEVYGIPVPMPGCQIGMELPSDTFSKVSYSSGSFSSMTFKKKSKGSMVNNAVYECYKNFTIMGKETKNFKVSATTVKNKVGSKKGYMGVGPDCIGYHHYFNVVVPK